MSNSTVRPPAATASQNPHRSESDSATNEFVDENTCVIKLTHGKVTLIDAVDLDLVRGYSWHAGMTGGKWYAMTAVYAGKRKGRTVYLHKLLTGTEGRGQQVDHINRDSLDNRRQNLRVCTHAQNVRNTKIYKSNTTGYKGTRQEPNDKWRVGIHKDLREYNVGPFDTLEEAARAYDALAVELHGEFAGLNFPGEPLQFSGVELLKQANVYKKDGRVQIGCVCGFRTKRMPDHSAAHPLFAALAFGKCAKCGEPMMTMPELRAWRRRTGNLKRKAA